MHHSKFYLCIALQYLELDVCSKQYVFCKRHVLFTLSLLQYANELLHSNVNKFCFCLLCLFCSHRIPFLTSLRFLLFWLLCRSGLPMHHGRFVYLL